MQDCGQPGFTLAERRRFGTILKECVIRKSLLASFCIEISIVKFSPASEWLFHETEVSRREKRKKKSEVATCSNNFFSRPIFNSPLHLVERGKLVPFSPLYLLLLYPFSHGAEALLVMDSSIILFFFLYSSLMACVCLEEHHGSISYSFSWKSSIFSFRKTFCLFSHIVKYKGSTLYNFFSQKKEG